MILFRRLTKYIQRIPAPHRKLFFYELFHFNASSLTITASVLFVLQLALLVIRYTNGLLDYYINPLQITIFPLCLGTIAIIRFSERWHSAYPGQLLFMSNVVGTFFLFWSALLAAFTSRFHGQITVYLMVVCAFTVFLYMELIPRLILQGGSLAIFLIFLNRVTSDPLEYHTHMSNVIILNVLTVILAQVLFRLRYHVFKVNMMIVEQYQELIQANTRLQELAITDTLTSAANRNRINEILEAEINRAHRYERSFSMIMIDLDHFKMVNDHHGHLAGDIVLKETCDLIRGSIRKADILGRWGGEELVIICPETRVEEAARMAENIRTRLEEYTFSNDLNITASFGIAQFKNDDTGQELIHKADCALYLAKEKGRNRIITSDQVCNQPDMATNRKMS